MYMSYTTVIIASHKILVCEKLGKSSNGETNMVVADNFEFALSKIK